MYEDQTYDELMRRKIAIINELDPSVDTREGSLIFFALAGNSAEQTQYYQQLDVIMNETFADTASRDNLIKRAAESGVEPDPATYAVLKGEFTPSNLEIALDTRFSLGGLNYFVKEKVSDGIYQMQCETAGVIGNQNLGDMVPVLYVQGLETCKLTQVLIPGEDAQATEDLRNEFFDSFSDVPFGGNRADYRQNANELAGVGGAKVYRAPDGGGSVKLVIIGSTYRMPTPELIASVQEAIDPVATQGNGDGIAPVGHVVTVSGVTETTVNIVTTITYQDDYAWADIQAAALASIDSYFLDLAKTWQDMQTPTTNTGLVVRISQIETRLLGIVGVLDIANTTINMVASNLTLDVDAIPVRGVIISG
ncbi:MAG: baseplate J/gp47 family protein [Acetobacterium sp.]|uniref:baseplate J/gp47 family protein n=1 Tax=Acetobacterium sp. TaxID=1872094 RepID=UPI003242EB69